MYTIDPCGLDSPRCSAPNSTASDQWAAPIQRPNIRGRAAGVQPDNPYLRTLQVDDFEHVAEDAEYLDALDRPPTQYLDDESQSIVATNDSPDVGFNYSVNPYRGCQTRVQLLLRSAGHEYLGMSAGIDFETKILVKTARPELLRQFLARPKWTAETIVFSGVTDCYQPAEREFKLTRGCLEVLAECRPTGGNHHQERAHHARHRSTAGAGRPPGGAGGDQRDDARSIARSRDGTADQRPGNAWLRAIETLAKAGVPTHVMMGPIIPGLTDSESPAILKRGE